MRETITHRLQRLEKQQNVLPRAVVTFSDGHRERMDFHQIAVVFSERNKAGIISLEWERSTDKAVIFQLLACPEIWEELTRANGPERNTNG